jgi:hypothetical protein
VLNNISKQIRECLQHAEDCAHKAAAHPDGSRLRQGFLEMTKLWLKLARSIQLTEQLNNFSRNASKPTKH